MSYAILRSASYDKRSGNVSVSARSNNVTPAYWWKYTLSLDAFARCLYTGDYKFQPSARCRLRSAFDYANERANVPHGRAPWGQAWAIERIVGKDNFDNEEFELTWCSYFKQYIAKRF